MGVWQGVAMDCLKFHPGPTMPDPYMLCFWGGQPAGQTAVFYPFGHRTPMVKMTHAFSRKKMKKTNPDEGFSTYEAATARQYSRLTQQMKPDMDSYVKQIEELGEEVYK
jgi:hypothetical protein